jgi:hypothetical protein
MSYDKNIIAQIIYDDEMGAVVEWNKNEININEDSDWEDVAFALSACKDVLADVTVMHALLDVMMKEGCDVTIH